MPNFDNLTPPTSAFIDSDNNVQDIQAVLESGAVVVTAAAPGPVVPIGTATTPQFDNIPPWVGKFVNPANEIVDLMDLLTSGAIQVQVSGGGGGGAPTTATYITGEDELIALPNSFPLSSLPTGFLGSETATGILTSRVLTGTASQLLVANGDGTDNPTFSISPTLVLPGTITLGGDLITAGFSLTQASGSMNLSAPTSVDFVTPVISVNALRHYGEATNKINFGTAQQSFLPDNVLRMRINASGVQLGNSGPFITNFSTDGTLSANSDTLVSTEKANKTYIDGTQTIIKAASFLTQADETSMLPNSISMAGLPDGFAMVFGGLLGTQLLTGTANQITVVGGDASGAAAVFSLPSTLVTPGTLDVGSTFSVGGTGSITSITTNPASASANALMPASTIQAAISAAVTGGVSFRGGWDASGGLYPATGGSGIAGAVAAGDWWYITVSGTLNTTSVVVGDQIFALVAVPGQTDANWLAVGIRVDSVFGRTGAVVATSGDYSFGLISGTAAVGQGGTGLTAVGSSGNILTSNGSVWTSAAPVITSVFGRTGVVVAATNDYNFNQLAGTAAPTQGGTGLTSPGLTGNVLTSDGAGNWTSSAPSVDSVFGRTGAVVATSGDYSFGLISGTAAATQGGTAQTTYATGDLLHASAANTLSKLTIGSTGDVLTVVAGDVAWVAPTAAPVTSVFGRTGVVVSATNDYNFNQLAGTAAVTQGGTGLTSTTINQLLYSSAANTIAGLATANNAILATNATGVPGFIGASPSQGQVIMSDVTGVWGKSVTGYPSGNAAVGTTLRANGSGYSATNWTIPATFGINNMVYASASNVMAAITSVNSAILRTSSTGVPAWSASLTNGQILIGSTGATPAAAALTQGTGITITNGAGTITITNSDGGSAVTLTNAGTTSLVNDGTGPALATKGLVAGAGMAAFGVSGTDVTINLAVPVTIANGGTNTTSAIGASGTMARSDGTKYTFTTATFPSTATGTGTVLRANGTNWVASTANFADTYASRSLLYANGANNVEGLATANNAILATDVTGIPGFLATVNSAILRTSAAGVPGWSPTLTNGQILIGSTGATPTAATLTNGTNITFTNGAGSITANLTGTVAIANGGTSFTTYTTGDLLYASASNVLSKRAIGSTGDVLTVSGGVPTWAAPSAGTAGSTGYIVMNTGNWTGDAFSFTTSYQELTSIGTNFTLAAGAVDFEMTTDGRLKYTGATTKSMLVSATIFVNNAGSFAMQLYKNGSAITNADIYEIGASSLSIVNFRVDSVATNDYISIFVKRSSNSAVFITQISLSVVSV